MAIKRKASTRTVETLGKVTYETKPNLSNVVAGFILGFGLVVAGLLLTGSLIRQVFLGGGNPPRNIGDWISAAIFALLAVAVSVGGVFMIKFSRSLVGFRLHLCTEGFWITRGKEQVVFAWDEIVLVRESIIEERLPLAKGAARHLIPTRTTRTYTVVRCDGEEFYFDENVIPRTSLLAGPLSAASKSRNVKWKSNRQQS